MKRSKAFTLIELLVVVAIIALLISILLPSLSKARELAKRSVCAANLAGHGKAIAMYANSARGQFPQATKTRVHRTEGAGTAGANASVTINPTGSADEADIKDSGIYFFDVGQVPSQPSMSWDPSSGLHRWQAIVVQRGQNESTKVANAEKDKRCSFPTRELYLLVKGNYSQVQQFVCPSTGHEADDLRADDPRVDGVQTHNNVVSALRLEGSTTEIVPAALLWDFLLPDNLDYGYMFGHDMDGEALSESMDPGTPVMADSNPYMRSMLTGGKITPSEQAARAAVMNKRMGDNSPNHMTEGQNVLFGDLHVSFFDHPTVGVGTDNIYTWHFSLANNPAGDNAVDAAPANPSPNSVANYYYDLVSRTDALIMP